MSLTKSIFLNGTANVVQKLVRILDQLLLVPFFLTQWGAEYYGEWLTLTIIPSILAFSDLGFGSAVSNSFVLAYASDDKKKAADIAKNGFYIILASVCLGVLMTIGVLAIGDYYNLFDKSHIDAHDAMLSVTFMMAARLLGFYSHMIEGFFRAVRKAHLSLFIGSGHNILNIVVGLIVLYSGYGVVGFSLAYLIISIVYMIIYSIIGYSFVDLEHNHGKIQKSVLKDLGITGLGFMLSPIWQSVYFQGGTFVVRITLGAEAVAIFNTIRTACRSINQLFNIINGTILPDLQFEYGRGNMPLVHRLYKISVLISMIIGVFGTIVLMFFGLDLYELWTQSVLSVSKPVWYVFMMGILFNAIWWTSMVVYRMANRPYYFAIVSTITAAVSIGLSYILAIYMGLLGAVIGAVAFDIIMAVLILPNSCKLLNMRVVDIFSNIKEDIYLIKRKLMSKK